jgi:hypothetical protein
MEQAVNKVATFSMEQIVSKVVVVSGMMQAPMLKVLLTNKVLQRNKTLQISKVLIANKDQTVNQVIVVKHRMTAICKPKALQEQQIVNKGL